MALRIARLTICVPLALALALACGCGGSDDDAASGGASTPTRSQPAPSPGAGAPPAAAGDGASGGGAFGAPTVARMRAARHRAFVRQVNAACRRVAAPPVAVGSEVARDRRSTLLTREREQLTRLLAALRALHAPPQDRELMRSYRRALRAQIVLDGILARGLNATDADDPGVRMGEYQNDFNRTDRDTLAKRLDFGDCLADHAS